MLHERNEEQHEEEDEKGFGDGECDEFGRLQFQPPLERSVSDDLVNHGNGHGGEQREQPTKANCALHTAVRR